MIKTLIRYTATALTCVILAVSIPFTSYADTTNEYQQQMEERKSLPIQSNEIANWPEGPAIGAESAQRSRIGAQQNRLEHTVKNEQNIVENTTAAESQIRDTEMAQEMVRFSGLNILEQAVTSMLAQANQSNQSVLTLLNA